ncbi:hypothetical protein [Cupriavidus pauculus]|uniref:hypothetical protein n=1 Tax=Cupriavidus pauculus TaxID=82633 RepID=UPI000A858EF8|nr:hypothetical protein [Cupriavidus pauculus]MCM3606037.1 hypothetical protein [Cupriavidus pauculus]UAL02926.1 hypothetical protein K8O84_19800 [Cupriavidus pauculus]
MADALHAVGHGAAAAGEASTDSTQPAVTPAMAFREIGGRTLFPPCSICSLIDAVITGMNLIWIGPDIRSGDHACFYDAPSTI